MKSMLVISVLFFGSAAASAQPMDEGQLSDVRAGYEASTGQDFSIGAVMKSTVDGNVVLQSTFNMNSAGTTTSQQFGTEALSPASAAGVTAGGITVPGDGGATTFLHNFGADQWTNSVLNSANGRNIGQSTDVTIAIPNLVDMQQQLALAGLTSRLHDTMGSGLVGARPH